MTSERDDLRRQVTTLQALEPEVQALRVRAQEAAELERTLRAKEAAMTELEGKYREEQQLRKKYWNMMEDMKGKIRVYARCRPMAQYEYDNGSRQVVRFVDATTLEVQSNRGPKEFIFDSVFTMASTQDEVSNHLTQGNLISFPLHINKKCIRLICLSVCLSFCIIHMVKREVSKPI